MAQGLGKKKLVVKAKKTSKPAKQHESKSAAPIRKGRVALQKHAKANMTASLEQAMSVKAGALGKLTIMKEAQDLGKKKEPKRRKY
ncbi:hypothetical protein DL89DRAFT_270459 [Linderina pennispora]|uniref:Uncharacterized protein n=1 Tax=Linderina pennispora TaxID=61395 RepID=A0A1Y1VYK0_9FUNG|nr:uncharacterized protein DL89DRAFT_270459 [Linderina pennispora]ORX65894.1 hypothetical protein DL89DRAFT_270459 [Linderina pennispora]